HGAISKRTWYGRGGRCPRRLDDGQEHEAHEQARGRTQHDAVLPHLVCELPRWGGALHPLVMSNTLTVWLCPHRAAAPCLKPSNIENTHGRQAMSTAKLRLSRRGNRRSSSASSRKSL